MFWKHCGNKIKEEGGFCEKCGTKIEASPSTKNKEDDRVVVAKNGYSESCL